MKWVSYRVKSVTLQLLLDHRPTIGGVLFTPGGPPVALAHITFSADSGISPGMIPITLIDYQGGTSLAEADATKPEFTIVNGQITVTGLPEPSSMVMAATALLLGLAQFRRRRCRE